jgi:hypothetical protein
LADEHIGRHLEVLSLDLINNGLLALHHMDAARKEKRFVIIYLVCPF